MVLLSPLLLLVSGILLPMKVIALPTPSPVSDMTGKPSSPSKGKGIDLNHSPPPSPSFVTGPHKKQKINEAGTSAQGVVVADKGKGKQQQQQQQQQQDSYYTFPSRYAKSIADGIHASRSGKKRTAHELEQTLITHPHHEATPVHNEEHIKTLPPRLQDIARKVLVSEDYHLKSYHGMVKYAAEKSKEMAKQGKIRLDDHLDMHGDREREHHNKLIRLSHTVDGGHPNHFPGLVFPRDQVLRDNNERAIALLAKNEDEKTKAHLHNNFVTKEYHNKRLDTVGHGSHTQYIPTEDSKELLAEQAKSHAHDRERVKQFSHALIREARTRHAENLLGLRDRYNLKSDKEPANVASSPATGSDPKLTSQLNPQESSKKPKRET
jgi:hypothetical protein